MKKKLLSLLLKGKIEKEFRNYETLLYDLDVDEMITASYEISCRQTIKDSLLDMLPSLSEEAIQLLLSVDYIIEYFYYSWSKNTSTKNDAVYSFMQRNLIGSYQIIESKERRHPAAS